MQDFRRHLTKYRTIMFLLSYNINWRDVQTKNVVNNVDMSKTKQKQILHCITIESEIKW